MTEYTDNDGNPISQRFFTDPEWTKRIFDATIDSYDQSCALEVVGWRAEGESWEYANEIAAMLNEVDALRHDIERHQRIASEYAEDAERYRRIAVRMAELNRKLREPDWHIESRREMQRELSALEDAAIAAKQEATK